MTLSKSRKILLLIGTVLPILYMIGFMVMTISLFFLTSHGNEQSWLFKNFGLLFVMHGIVMLLMMSILVIYLIYIFKSNMDQQMKILWAIVIFVG
ncbi:MAG TPA: hypothetical protein VLH08_00885, partial [Acidobacteriota bacterium]|nr:hypothetical protein [Acidobacteriota bacterium]